MRRDGTRRRLATIAGRRDSARIAILGPARVGLRVGQSTCATALGSPPSGAWPRRPQPRSRRARAAAPPPSARRAPSRYQGFRAANRRLAVGSRRPRARTAPVIAVAGSTRPRTDGRRSHRVLRPRPGCREIVTAAVSDPSTVTVADEFHRARPSWAERRRRRAAAPRGSRATRTTSSLLTWTAFDRVGPSPSSSSPSLRSPPPTPSPCAAAPHVQLYETAGGARAVSTSPSSSRARFFRDAGLDGLGARVSQLRDFLRQRRAARRCGGRLRVCRLCRPPRRAHLQLCLTRESRRGRLAIRIRRLRAHVRRRRRARLRRPTRPDQRVRRKPASWRSSSRRFEGWRWTACLRAW